MQFGDKAYISQFSDIAILTKKCIKWPKNNYPFTSVVTASASTGTHTSSHKGKIHTASHADVEGIIWNGISESFVIYLMAVLFKLTQTFCLFLSLSKSIFVCLFK